MSGSPTGPRAAYIEDYNEDAKTTLPETRRTANITAKRSKPDIVKPSTVTAAHDEFSDSGYSSRTGATLGSGDSSLDSKAGSAPLRVDTNAAHLKGRPGILYQEQPHTAEAVRKPTLRRTDSRAKEKGPKPQQECRCNDCKAKGYNATKSLEQSRSSKDDATRPTSKAPPQVSVPQRPHSTKPLPHFPPPEAPPVLPTQARPRPITAQSQQRQRPTSFQGGSFPPQVTYHPVYLAQAQPTMTPPGTFPPTPYPPPAPSYFAPTAPVQHSPYPYSTPPSPLDRCPPLRWWDSDQPAPQRHPIMYSTAPVIEHAQQPHYATSVQSQPTIRRTPVQRGYSHPPREEHYVRDEDYYSMPPPPPPPPRQQTQRPTIRHAATTSVAHAAIQQRRNSRTDVDPDLYQPQSPVKTKAPIPEPPQRPTVTTRPSVSSSNNSASSSHGIEREMRRMSIESNSTTAKKRRPFSYYGHESPRDLERSVEAYQNSTGTSTALPLTADSLNLVRKKAHSNSETGTRLSAQSKGSKRSSEDKGRSLTDRRSGSDSKPRNEADGLTMRFNASQAVNVDFKGEGIKGRTISLRPSNDGDEGDMVLGIGGKSGAASSRAPLKEKGRKRYSYVESSGTRELEAGGGGRRSRRESRTRESSRAAEKRVAVSRSRRSSRSGRS